MTSRSRTLGALTVLTAAAALAGCGGSGSSKADFVKKADTLCAQTNRAHPQKTPKTAQQAVTIQAEEIAIRTELDRKLRALKPPDSAKSDFAAYNAGTRKVIAAIATLRNDAAAKDEKKYATDNAAFTSASVEREKSAVKLGFKTCGRKKPAG
jgi:hypothetical protein